MSYCFFIGPRYRQILEGHAIGNASHEKQLYNATTFAHVDVTEAWLG